MSRGLKIIYIPEKNNRVENKSTETQHRQRSGVHPWSIRTDLGRHGAKENSGDAESDRRRPSQKSNIPQRESRIRLRSCRGVRSTFVSQGILRQSDELSGELHAISFKNYFCGARSLMLWFALRFFNFTGYTQRRSRTLLESICCDLLSDFLTLRDIHNHCYISTIISLLWFAFRFFNFTDIHNRTGHQRRHRQLWFAFRFFNFTDIHNRFTENAFGNVSCDLLSDFLTLRIYTTDRYDMFNPMLVVICFQIF